MGARRPFFLRGRALRTNPERETSAAAADPAAVESALPGVEVLAVELSWAASASASTSIIPQGVDHALCARVTDVLRDYLDAVHDRRLVAGARAPAAQAGALPRAPSAARSPFAPRRDRRPQALPRRGRRAPASAAVTVQTRRRRLRDPVRRDRAGQPDRRADRGGMTQEIIEAVREIEREKGIEHGTLVSALEDALLAAYKKTPGRVPARDRRARRRGRLPRLLDRAAGRPRGAPARRGARARDRGARAARGRERRASHTLLTDDDLDIDWSQVPEEQVKREDVTPDNFGRIAAQTAKQVILQRIREAERAMMYDEYIDRVRARS